VYVEVVHAICHVISFHCRLLASPESVVLVLMAAAHTCHVIVSISRASRVCSDVLCAVVTPSFLIPALKFGIFQSVDCEFPLSVYRVCPAIGLPASGCPSVFRASGWLSCVSRG
jgi:hypothetical protein